MVRHGFLLIDKPAGITSFKVISKLRKITSIRKIGHTGTLDPFATGLLPICVGKATRLAQFLSTKEKSYEAQIRFGIETDTGDMTGEITAESKRQELDQGMIDRAVDQVKKIKEQIPPAYSAVKVNGKRAYKLARSGEEVNLPPRQIQILDFRVLSWDNNHLSYQATVSKGTYIRTLSQTLAGYLGNLATTVSLRRLSVGKLDIGSAVSLDELNSSNWENSLVMPEDILSLPQLYLDSQEAFKFVNGVLQQVDYKSEKQYLVMLREADKAIGIGRITDSGLLKPEIVLGI